MDNKNNPFLMGALTAIVGAAVGAGAVLSAQLTSLTGYDPNVVDEVNAGHPSSWEGVNPGRRIRRGLVNFYRRTSVRPPVPTRADEEHDAADEELHNNVKRTERARTPRRTTQDIERCTGGTGRIRPRNVENCPNSGDGL